MDIIKSANVVKHKKTIYMIIAGMVGILLLIFPWPKANPQSSAPISSDTQQPVVAVAATSSLRSYEISLANDLEQILKMITGVGDIRVMVKIQSGTELEIAQNVVASQRTTREDDGQGGTRVISEENKTTQVVFSREPSSQGDKPLVLREISPKIAGVVVVAEGAERPQTRASIISAVQTVLDIGAHRVEVYPKN